MTVKSLLLKQEQALKVGLYSGGGTKGTTQTVEMKEAKAALRSLTDALLMSSATVLVAKASLMGTMCKAWDDSGKYHLPQRE